MTSSCLFGHCPVSFHNLLAENLSRLPSVEFFFITNEKLHFRFDYLVLFVAALFWILSCSFPTFLSTEGNTNVRETQEDPQLSACLGSNKRDLTCQHDSGNREPRCSCLLDSWNQLFKKWGNENWGWYIRMYQPHCHFLNMCIHCTVH